MITVFTPTYNRAYIIDKLYKSLCQQTCKDFEWLVVDDGSTDNTKELINSFITENKIIIRYIHKENGGKHTAINLGVKEAHGELFFIVDSDDHLTNDAIEWIRDNSQEIINNNRYAGLSGIRVTPNGDRIGGGFFPSVIECSALEIRNKLHIKGDLAEIYKTAILRQYPFPIFKNEKFVTEALIWNRVAINYILRYTNKAVYICEYRNDGLTAQMTKLRKLNPQATALYYSEYYTMPIPLKEQIKTAINYWRFAPYNKTSFFRKIKQIGIISMYAIPLGYAYYIIDKLSTR